MNTKSMLVAFIVAIAFGTWPIVAKYSGASLAWVTVMIYLGGLLSVSALAFRHLVNEPICTLKGVLILVVASVINGVAVWFYTMKSVDKEINTALFMVFVSLSGIIIAPLFNRFLMGESLTNKQYVGIALSLVVVWLMKK